MLDDADKDASEFDPPDAAQNVPQFESKRRKACPWKNAGMRQRPAPVT